MQLETAASITCVALLAVACSSQRPLPSSSGSPEEQPVVAPLGEQPGEGRNSAPAGSPPDPTAAASSQAPRDPACGHRGDPEPATVAGMTAAHNAIRCRVARPSKKPLQPLSWSRALASDAQRYADAIVRDKCNLQHSETELGENLFGGTGNNTAVTVVERWAAEERCFRYGRIPKSCRCTCGHYTQLVWGQTERLGCGMATCADGSQVWVCRYDPAGNYAGDMPY
jgi:hypothetical protein